MVRVRGVVRVPAGYSERMSAPPQKPPMGNRIAGELQRSGWISLAIPPLGFATWAAFLYVGLAYRRTAWLVASGVYAAALFAAFVLIEAHRGEHGGLHAFGGFLVLAIWIGGFAHAMVVRRERREPPRPSGDPALAAATERLSERRAAQALALKDPALARELGIGRPDIAGAHPRGVVDVNHANVEAIMATAGVSR